MSAITWVTGMRISNHPGLKSGSDLTRLLPNYVIHQTLLQMASSQYNTNCIADFMPLTKCTFLSAFMHNALPPFLYLTKFDKFCLNATMQFCHLMYVTRIPTWFHYTIQQLQSQ